LIFSYCSKSSASCRRKSWLVMNSRNPMFASCQLTFLQCFIKITLVGDPRRARARGTFRASGLASHRMICRQARSQSRRDPASAALPTPYPFHHPVPGN
jgi:hypothetical protein